MILNVFGTCYGGKEGKGDGLVPELHTFTFTLQVYVSLEGPDTEKRNQQVGEKQEEDNSTHAKANKQQIPDSPSKVGEREQEVHL